MPPSPLTVVKPPTYTLAELAQSLALRLHLPAGVPDVSAAPVRGLATLQRADGSCLSFFANTSYRKDLLSTQALGVILSEQSLADCPVAALVSDNPYLSWAHLTALFNRAPRPTTGSIHATAVIHPSAQIAATASIGAHCVIAAGVRIEDDVVISSACTVGEGSVIGARGFLHARVTLYHGVLIGSDVVIHSGAVIGADGFGFAPQGNGWCKVHQLGGVVIGNKVEIGANTCVDRGALDDTVICDGAIIDNLVQIAHNVCVGENTAIAACSGISGSSTLGANCTLAGNVGLVGHIHLADRVHITGKSMVTGSIKESGSYSSGTPLMPTASWRKNAVRFSQLTNLFRRVAALESGAVPQSGTTPSPD